MKATLTYHSIDSSGSAISVTPDAFEAHARWLTSGRVRVLSLDALVAHPDGAGDAVAVTFDDGILNARAAAERLLADGVPVTLFVTTAQRNGMNSWGGSVQPGIPELPLLDWHDLERLVARGAAVESHARRHVPLVNLSPAEQDDELGGSREDVRVRLGRAPSHVAYPYGAVDADVEARAARWFRYGHTVDFRMLRADDAPLRLPRLDMYYFQAAGAIEAWGRASFRRHVAWCQLRREVRVRMLGGWVPRAAAKRA